MKADILEQKMFTINKGLKIVIPLLFFAGCTHKDQVNIDQLNWIIGSREMVNGDELIIETWKQKNDTLMIGESYVITPYDTMLTETIKIIQKQEGIYYVPLVFNQNKGSPVSFKLTSNDPEKLIFENLKHDFPKTICYYKERENINVWIEGDTKKIEFYFTKIIK